jgi:hypothetical protein
VRRHAPVPPGRTASDIKHRRIAGVPDDIVFKRKWEIALNLLDEALLQECLVE